MAAPSPGPLLALLALCATVLGPCVAADVDYTPPVLNESYVSDPRFIAHGLAPFYKGVRWFLKGIRNDDLLPPGVLLVQNGDIIVDPNIDYKSVANFYVGILAVLCIGLAVVVLAPCVGLMCCCCCSGSKRRRGHSHKDGHDDESMQKPKKAPGAPLFAPLVLCAITCIIVAGVAIAFAANAYVERGLGGIGKHVTSGTEDLRLYVDNAQTELNTFLGLNYDELATGLTGVLAGGISQTKGIVDGFVGSLPLDEMDKMAEGIESIEKDLNNIKLKIEESTATAGIIDKDLGEAQTELQEICTNIGTQCPNELKNLIDSLTLPPFPPLPVTDIDMGLAELTKIIPSDFKEAFRAGRKEINQLGDQVENVMKEVSNSMQATIKETRKNLQKRASDLIQATSDASDTLITVDDKVREIQDTYNRSYADYRIIAFTIYAGVILIVAALFTLGLVFGVCSSKHSYSFLNFPVILIVLIISVWMVLLMALFITGVATDIGCEFLRKPGDNQVTNLIDEYLEQNRDHITDSSLLPPLRNISSYVNECRLDKTLYEVIGLESTIPIDDIVNYVQDFDFDPYLRSVYSTMDDVAKRKLLSPEIEKNIKDLQTSEVSTLDLTTIKDELKQFSATAEPLKDKIVQWQSALQKIAGLQIDVTDPVSKVNNVADQAKTLISAINELTTLVTSLEKDLKLGQASFSDAMEWILTEASKTDSLIVKSSPDIKKVARNTAEGFRKEMEAYLQWAVARVKLHALKCRPIINVYDTLVMGVCDEIISPYNAFWAVSGLCLLLLIPAAFVARSLASRNV